ncbi:MAG TPA: hypothetical protein VNK04_06450, partial [Gemmataceae bacterium]|nr:hypothetical protein [Gemmataceae bacterium]
PVPRGQAATPVRDPAVTPVAHTTAALAAPPSVVRAQSADPVSGPPPVPPPPGAIVPPPGAEPYNCGVVSGPAASPFGFGPCLERGWFRSDHCFDQFISPVSNPFLFEDPRALTEARPIFIYQSAPAGNPIFRGGDIEFFGTQFRVALSERLSFVVNKLGFIWIEPNNPTGEFAAHTGFSELWLGPKFTFLRNETTETLGALGLTFQIPTGPQKVFQNTGDLSLVPYVSLGQNFLRSSYGSFNALGTTGYAFAVDDRRSEYYFLSFHLDYDIANLHKIYPLIELNWTHYTQAGGARNLRFEGRDLINFGARQVSGNDNLTLATGLRYKFTEWLQAGIATEWPIVNRKDLLDFRLTADLIFRY